MAPEQREGGGGQVRAGRGAEVRRAESRGDPKSRKVGRFCDTLGCETGSLPNFGASGPHRGWSRCSHRGVLRHWASHSLGLPWPSRTHQSRAACFQKAKGLPDCSVLSNFEAFC